MHVPRRRLTNGIITVKKGHTWGSGLMDGEKGRSWGLEVSELVFWHWVAGKGRERREALAVGEDTLLFLFLLARMSYRCVHVYCI